MTQAFQASDPILLRERDGGALRLTLNRPATLNALSPDLLAELRDALEAAEADAGVRAVLITGAGRGFSSGADLGATRIDGDIGEVIEATYNPVARAIARMPKPVVAAVNGVAAGAGMSLALACDLRILSSAASFAVGFPGIGLVLDASGSYTLPRLVGPGRAMELALTNRRIGADEALALGLGERVVPEEGFAEAAWEFARTLAQGPTAAFGGVKRQLRASLDQDLEAQLALEVEEQRRAAVTSDFQEGVRAFREKRAPRFEGR